MSNQISKTVIVGLLTLLTLGCLSETSSTDFMVITTVEVRRSDDSIVDFKLSTKRVNRSGFLLSTKRISAEKKCVHSESEERFKVKNDVLYKEVSVLGTSEWIPYLILKQGECIVSPNWDHFGSLSESNCTISMNRDSIVYQTQVRRVNGNIEKEEIVTLNPEYLPIRTIETMSIGESLVQSYVVDLMPELVNLKTKCK
ncbi:hypothetical protein GGR26_001742 [Lewinella marina]|uniref:hypothetical protein n=1 Tax=Neolewinella marina TaxID=438751 RepID=UPI00117A5FD4|nr:hypothetical protein [Neolewinella marina]NJB85974.1 hypothetical protein [Neolewinella marina]